MVRSDSAKRIDFFKFGSSCVVELGAWEMTTAGGNRFISSLKDFSIRRE